MHDLVVRARLRSPAVSLPPLDGLLGFVVAEERGLVAGFGDMVYDLPLPLERSACGRVWLASFAVSTPEMHEPTFVQRRFPVAEYQAHGDAKRSINLSAGVNRSYRIPTRVIHVTGDVVTWYARGDADEISRLLSSVGHLGKRRGVGRGAVASWEVEPCEPWPGFPVLCEGVPLRALPVDWPGVTGGRQAYATMVPPYWEHRRAELAWVPS
jgi:CRISPR type IV-associated protein Csf3